MHGFISSTPNHNIGNILTKDAGLAIYAMKMSLNNGGNIFYREILDKKILDSLNKEVHTFSGQTFNGNFGIVCYLCRCKCCYR